MFSNIGTKIQKNAVPIVILGLVMFLAVTSLGPASFTDISAPTTSTGQNASQTSSLNIPSLNILTSTDRCSEKTLEYCAYNQNQYEDARAEAQLEVSSYSDKIIRTVEGVKYVESDAEIQYKCGEPRPAEGINHKMFVWTGEPEYSFSQLPSGEPEAVGDGREVANEGIVSIAFDEPTSITLSCVAWDTTEGAWASTWTNAGYSPIVAESSTDDTETGMDSDDGTGVSGGQFFVDLWNWFAGLL